MNFPSDVFIVAAARTPIGCFQGSFSSIPAHDLSAVVIKELISRSNLQPADIDEVIMGQTLLGGQGQNPARQASLKAGLPVETPAYVINTQESGLKSIALGFQAIRTCDSKIVVAGGQENLTRSPHFSHLRGGLKFGSTVLKDTMIYDGFTEEVYNQLINEAGEASENSAEEIVAISVKDKIVIDKDECLFNVLQSDSSAVVILASFEEIQKRKLTPLSEIVGFSLTRCGKTSAISDLLKKCSWSINDVDLFQMTEVVAGQVKSVMKNLNIDENKVKITKGHSIGASGTIALVSLIYTLNRAGKKRGVVGVVVDMVVVIAMAIEIP